MDQNPRERLARIRELAGVRAYEFQGFIIVCGKTARDNEVLSLKFAAQGDHWFHARGVAGSHVLILRAAGRLPNRDVINAAAALTIYFSKYRGGGLCPVSYCDGSAVNRVRGAATGTVAIRGERVVKVRPLAPENIPGLEPVD